MSIPKLLMTIYNAYNFAIPQKDGMRGRWQPILSNGQLVETFCNETIQFIIKQTDDYSEFEGLQANAIYDVCVEGKDWQEINATQCQIYANQGIASLLSWKNLSGGHGHVCVAVPGELWNSSSWNDVCPIVMNVGKDVFIGKPASFAFTANERPRYFVLKKNI